MNFSNYLVFKMSRRFADNEVPAKLYDAMYEKLSMLAPPWGLQGLAQIPMKDFKGAVTLGVKYTKVEKSSPIKSMYFGFMSRHRTAPPPDQSMSDDSFTVEFFPKKVSEDRKYLLDVVFPAYVSATAPYYGRLFSDEIEMNDVFIVDLEEGCATPNPNFVDSRQGVHRIWQANYWDRELCRRSFNMTPDEIVERLSGNVASCRVFENGVIVVCSYEELSKSDILGLNDTVLPLLRNAI